MTTTTDEQLTIPDTPADPDAPEQPDTPPPSRDGATEPGPEPAKTTRSRKTTGKGRPARKTTTRSKPKDDQPKPPPGVSAKGNRLSLAKDLEGFLAMVGTVVSTFEPYDGAVIIAQAGTTARRLDDIAKDNPAIHRTLAMLTQGSGGAMGVAFALMPIVLPIMHHHGITPDSDVVSQLVAGMVPPDVQKLHTDRPRPPKPDGKPTGDDGPMSGRPVG